MLLCLEDSVAIRRAAWGKSEKLQGRNRRKTRSVLGFPSFQELTVLKGKWIDGDWYIFQNLKDSDLWVYYAALKRRFLPFLLVLTARVCCCFCMFLNFTNLRHHDLTLIMQFSSIQSQSVENSDIKAGSLSHANKHTSAHLLKQSADS